jgi:glutamate formiminotransferase/formiminotetrahydrofolate cyclodeaminase
VRRFIEVLGSRTPAPGGGSASALMAGMGAALGAMVGWMTYGKRKFEDKDTVMRRLIPPLHAAMAELIPMIDADTDAFNDYLAALGLPKDTPEQAKAREAAMQAGLQKAVEVPLRAMRVADGCWDAMLEMAAHGNIASRSDLEVGAKALETGIWGAWRNVVINVDQIKDEPFRRRVSAEGDEIRQRAAQRLQDVLDVLGRR